MLCMVDISFLFVAALAIEQIAEELVSPLLRQHPRSFDQRRVVAHVLPVSAGENGPPITQFVLIEGNDTLFHDFGNGVRYHCPWSRFIR